MTSRRTAALIGALAVLVTACGAGAPAAQESPAPAGPRTPMPTSPAPSAAPSAASSTAPTPAPTPAPVIRWPLTGMPAQDPAAVKRRPLNVRLPNDPFARPQQGLALADIVFDLLVEGDVTRYSAIYHSRNTNAVGPVRSYRFSDLHLTQLFRGALVASGATIEEKDAVTTSVEAGNMLSVDADRAPGVYYRVGGRAAPNNLFADLEAARGAVNEAGGGGPVDVPPLTFLASVDHEPAAGGFVGSIFAATVTIPLRREPVTFTWDEGSRGYRRTQAGTRTIDPAGSVPILARNVIVMHTNIWQTSVIEDIFGSRGLDYRMTGGGGASVFRDGRRQDGTWRRDGPLAQFAFFDQGGNEIALSPGQSWIHFVYPDWEIPSVP